MHTSGHSNGRGDVIQREPERPRNPAEHEHGLLRDAMKGLFWAALIVASILFYSAGASHFIYVDF